MRIRLIDVDGHNFPNIPLMKISAYYKNRENDVAWYDPLTDWHTPVQTGTAETDDVQGRIAGEFAGYCEYSSE